MDLFAILVSFEKATLLELFAFFVREAVVDAAAQSETLFRPGFLWTVDVGQLSAFLDFCFLVLTPPKALTIEKLLFEA